MITLFDKGINLVNGIPVEAGCEDNASSREKTMAFSILTGHNQAKDLKNARIKFDALISHDITYCGIIQTARASGLAEFPVPYALTNCHNSLCAVGGTINEDDHAFGLSAAKKYGGIYVPANMAVIHQYAREMMATCGGMILGSDSHTRYGALGCMGVGEGGPELVKQLLGNTYDLSSPKVVLVYMEGEVPHGVGPHDVALAICGAVYKNGFVKNKIMEFAGPGIANLPMDFRIAVDVMTTETACLSSVWATDDKTKKYYVDHGRADAYKAMAPGEGAYYDCMVRVNLSKVKPMIALPYHPSNAYTIDEFRANAKDILADAGWVADKWQNGKFVMDQGVIAGCSGGMYQNIAEAAAILRGRDVGGFPLSVYPASLPVNVALADRGHQATLMRAGALFKPCFCGPCFGAGDVPRNMGLSARHTTRNFPNREGSKPSEGQMAAVALMDARSIAATALNGGVLTPANEIDYERNWEETEAFDSSIYAKNVYFGVGRPQKDASLLFGPGIADWPKFEALRDNVLIGIASSLNDAVTTTDELIPSGETSSYRSNPIRLSEFALSRRDPEYVGRSKAIRDGQADWKSIAELVGAEEENTTIGSGIWANCPGDGSAREQAASCQRVLGGIANISAEYATRRYRANLINWGILPFIAQPMGIEVGDWIYVPNVREHLISGAEEFAAVLVRNGEKSDITVKLPGMTAEERELIAQGCLINHYAAQRAKE
ncbi:MAG: hydratase [Clostridiales bacterium]|nr:hydratase [Clostridiales bacterium]